MKCDMMAKFTVTALALTMTQGCSTSSIAADGTVNNVVAQKVDGPAVPPVSAKDDPLLKPIAPEYAKRWLDPVPPTQIYGNSYLVGFGDLNVGLIQTNAGLILIDGAVPQAVASIEENIRALGFKLSDIKYILSTEPHYDHSGGIAALQRDTGAEVIAGVAAVKELEAGEGDPHEPQGSSLEKFPAVKNVRGVRDGETVTLGDVTVTAVATPGHTLGSTSWAWQSCQGQECRAVVFAASANPVASGTFRFSDAGHDVYPAAYAVTFKRLRSINCDILLTAHPSQSDGAKKLAALRAGATPNPFVNANSCKIYADAFEKRLKDKLVKEVSGKAD